MYDPPRRVEKNKAILSDRLVGFERRSTCTIFTDRFYIPPSPRFDRSHFELFEQRANYLRPFHPSSVGIITDRVYCFIHGLRSRPYASHLFLSLSLSLGLYNWLRVQTPLVHRVPSIARGANLRKHRCARHIKSIRRAEKRGSARNPFRKSPKIMNCRLPYLLPHRSFHASYRTTKENGTLFRRGGSSCS